MAPFSSLPASSTVSNPPLFAIDVPLPPPQAFLNDIHELAWSNALTYAGLAVSVIGVALLIKTVSK